MRSYAHNYRYLCSTCDHTVLMKDEGSSVICGKCGKTMSCRRRLPTDYVQTYSHYFLITPERSSLEKSAVEYAAHLRSSIKQMPPTKATFTLGSVFDGEEWEYSWMGDHIVNFCGAWAVPEWIETGDSKRYVNPNYTHADTYQEVGVECRCGAILGDRNARHPYTSERMHKGRCPKMYSGYIDEIVEQRGKIIAQGLRMGFSCNELSDRLGHTRVAEAAKEAGLDIQRLKDEYYWLREKTVEELTKHTEAKIVAEAYDIEPSRVSDILGCDNGKLGREPADEPVFIV